MKTLFRLGVYPFRPCASLTLLFVQGTLNPYLQNCQSLCRDTVGVIAQKRAAWCRKWTQRALELREEENNLKCKLAPHLRSLLSGKRLTLWREMLVECDYPDMEVFDELVSGTALTGPVPATFGVFFKRETLFEALVEHFVLRLQVVHKEETVRFSGRLLVQPVRLLLRQQCAQLLDDGIELVLVAQPPAAEELHVDPHGGADEPQLLGTHPGADLHVTASDEERVKGAVGLVKLPA